jgi:hypothetical protein
MTAPASTPRGYPTGKRLTDGFKTEFAFALNPTISFWELTVQPPGVDGGEAINTTTMLNLSWRTMAPRALRTLTPSTVNAAYDPILYNDILSLINHPGAATCHFSNGDTLDFYGFVQKFEPKECKEGDMPQATVIVTPTNYDPSAGTEEPPVLTVHSGTYGEV